MVVLLVIGLLVSLRVVASATRGKDGRARQLPAGDQLGTPGRTYGSDNFLNHTHSVDTGHGGHYARTCDTLAA